MIEIDGVTYTDEQLTASDQVAVNRINELQADINRHKMTIMEEETLVSTYAGIIKQSVDSRVVKVDNIKSIN